MQRHLLVLHRLPQALDEQIVPLGAIPIHLSLHSCSVEAQPHAPELAALVVIHNLRFPAGRLNSCMLMYKA
jgi:hypothetical protein